MDLDLFSASPILMPILVLVIWTFIQMAWMVVTRLPAISAAGLPPEAGQRTGELAEKLPKAIQWKADNYNHLHEQPTLFYAVAIVAAVAGAGEGLNLYLAWGYVVLRVVHSIIQSTSNNVPVRFGVFALASLALLIMAGNTLTTLL